MWLAYLDESGNTGSNLQDANQPVHWMAAVLIPEDQILTVRKALDGIVATSGVNVSSELHGAEMFGGDGAWRGLSPDARIAAYSQALSLIGDNGCVVAHSSIDKRKLQGTNSALTSPHLMAFQFLAEKVQGFVGSQKDDLRRRALFVADESDEYGHYQLELLRDMQDGQGGIGSSTALTNIVDTVHFVDSRTNRGVQLVDLVAYALNRCLHISEKEVAGKSISNGDVAIRQMAQDLIYPFVRTYRSRWPF